MKDTIIYFRNQSAEFSVLLNHLPRLPMANIRKLFKLMLACPTQNDEAIQTTAAWFPEAIEAAKLDWGAATTSFSNGWRDLKCFVQELPRMLTPDERRKAVSKQRKLNQVLYSALKSAKADYERLLKIQTIFNEIKGDGNG